MPLADIIEPLDENATLAIPLTVNNLRHPYGELTTHDLFESFFVLIHINVF